jgi:hypothetical protein
MKKFVTSRDILNKALALTVKNGGCTLKPETGEEATTGYAVGGIREFKFYDARIEQTDEMADAIAQIRKNHPAMDIGFWLDGSTLYIDAVLRFPCEESARLIGTKLNEVAIYDLNTGTEIRLK